MIKNQIIIEKLNEKTKDDPDMNRFIHDILELDSEGKNFKKIYAKNIRKYVLNSKNQNGR